MATGKRSELSDYESGDENASDRWLYRKRFDGDFARLSRVDVRSGDRQWITRDFDFDIEAGRWPRRQAHRCAGQRRRHHQTEALRRRSQAADGASAAAGRDHRSELAPQRARPGAVDQNRPIRPARCLPSIPITTS